jgi:hypothetical protein
MKEMLTKRSFEPITNCNCVGDKEKQIFDKYGNYDFPTELKQDGLNSATSQIEEMEELSKKVYEKLFSNHIRILSDELSTSRWVAELLLETYNKGVEKGNRETAEKIYLQAKAIVDATKHIVQGREYLHIDALKEIIRSCGFEIKE